MGDGNVLNLDRGGVQQCTFVTSHPIVSLKRVNFIMCKYISINLNRKTVSPMKVISQSMVGS